MRKGLPQVSGRGFLISKGVELGYSKGGTAYARLPLAFSHRVKEDDEWVTKNEIVVQGVAFGELAEYLANAVPEGEHAEIDVAGEIYTEDWEDREGETHTSVKMTVSAAGVVPPQQNNRSKSKSQGRKREQQDPWADVPPPSAPSDDPWGSYSGSDDEPPF